MTSAVSTSDGASSGPGTSLARGFGPAGRRALAAAILIQLSSAPGQTVGVSVFIDQFVVDLDLSRSQVAAAYLVGTLVGAASMPTVGRLVDRRGLRWATLAFGASFACVLVGMGGVNSLLTLTVGFAFTRMLGQGALTLTATTSVAIWFDRNRGSAMGILAAVGGGLMSLVPLLGAALIHAFGWRWAWVALGALVASTTLPVALVMVRQPSRMPVPALDAAAIEAGVAHLTLPPPSIPVGLAVRTRAFAVVAAGVGFAAALSTALIFHQIALLGERGLSAVQAAANFLPQTLAAAAAALTVGRLADRTDPRRLLSVSLGALGAAGLSVLLVTGPSSAALYGAALGAAASAVRTIEAAVLPRWFGTANIGELRGFILSAGVAGSALGPLLLSLPRDLLGSYAPSLWAFAGVAALLATAAARVRPPEDLRPR